MANTTAVYARIDTNLKEKEREGTKTERYFVTGRNQEEKDMKFSLPYKEWCTVEIDQVILVDIFWGSGNLVAETDKNK